MKPRRKASEETSVGMTSRDVVELLQLFQWNGIDVCVDGGWGVDALLGHQTRSHRDLDIAVPHKFVQMIRQLLAAKGYKEIPRDDSWECNFVLGDNKGREVDVHSYTFDDNGDTVHRVAYKPEHLTGTGSIGRYPVKCISPEWMIQFHSAYAPAEKDYHDVKALCERFGILLPSEYERFARRTKG